MKIAVFDPLLYEGDLGTFGPYLEHLGKTHEVRHYAEKGGLTDAYRAHQWADITWYEWCDDWTRLAVTHPKLFKRPDGTEHTCKIIVRLHSYELFTPIPAQMEWLKVDRLVTVSETMKNMIMKQTFRYPLPPIDVLPNGVDTSRFKFNENKDYSTKKIAYVGWLNHKKNPQMLLYIMDAIRDMGYTLHIAGEWQDPRLAMYMTDMIEKMNLGDCITFYGRIPHDQLPAWLEDKAYIISTSLFESFGQALMEGIACGCLPLVHDFIGAQERFGDLAVFRGVEDLQRWLPGIGTEELIAEPARARAKGAAEHIRRFSLENQYPALDSIIEQVAAA